jgi:hypothetical protein
LKTILDLHRTGLVVREIETPEDRVPRYCVSEELSFAPADVLAAANELHGSARRVEIARI